MTTPPGTPPMGASDEAEPDQPGVARAEGDADTRALQAMDQESGAVTRGAGDDLVAFVQEPAEGMDELDDGRLVGREAPTQANAHLEIAVADDAADGRFVPALDITLTLLAGDRELCTTTMALLWHPDLDHSGTNARVPGQGPCTVRVQIAAPSFLRHDPVNGRRDQQVGRGPPGPQAASAMAGATAAGRRWTVRASRSRAPRTWARSRSRQPPSSQRARPSRSSRRAARAACLQGTGSDVRYWPERQVQANHSSPSVTRRMNTR
jgi:hypothetical protein